MKKAVLLMSMGGPSKPKDIRPFLFNLFKDPAIIRLPFWMRLPLAYFIAWKRAPIAKVTYAKIDGQSPLLENTHKQAHALEKALNALSVEDSYRCFVGMSYWHPFINQAVNEIEKYNPDEVILLPLYPQFSTTTTVPAMRDAYKALKRAKISTPVNGLKSFQKNEGFIEFLVKEIEKAWGEATCYGRPVLLFSAHGLPLQVVKDGDPYPLHCKDTMDAILVKLSIEVTSTLCYQSQIAGQKWIEPYLEDEIKKACAQKRPIIVVPISFVSEHSETLVELHIEEKKRALGLGAPFYKVVRTVSDDPFFINGLAHLLTKK